MATKLSDKRLGLVLGSWIADSISLGVHWIYDTDELAAKFGYVDQFYAPGSDSYHPNKRAGELGHVGDQSLKLATFLQEQKQWDQSGFMEAWISMWLDYADYFDHATKSTLANLDSGAVLAAAGSDSNELAGPARIAPLVAFLSDQPEEVVVEAAVQQTVLTHNSPETVEAATFLATAAYRLMHGGELVETIKATAPAAALKKAKAVLDLGTVEAIGQLGQSCPSVKAVPGVIYLALKFGDDLPKAFSENAMAGGDNCARALALGMLLGAAHGSDAIPQVWRDDLKLGEAAVFLELLGE